jgi:hypothetical protein
MKYNAKNSTLARLATVWTGFMVSFAGHTGPAPGYGDIVPPGTWSDRWTAYYRAFEMGDGATYVVSSLNPWQDYADGTGDWDWIREYVNASLWLNNVPGTAWYAPGDTNSDFVISIPTLTVKLRNPNGGPTNPYAAYLEMEVSAHAGNVRFLATYAGQPTVTNVPETLDELAYTLATGGLASARLAVSSPDGIGGASGLGIRAVPAPGSGIELSWNSATNRLYQVQICADLSTGIWADAGSPLIGSVGILRAREAITPSAAQMFYRVLEYP